LKVLTRCCRVPFFVLFLVFPLLPANAQSALPDSPSFSRGMAAPAEGTDARGFPASASSPQTPQSPSSDADYSVKGLLKRGLQDQKDIYPCLCTGGI